MRQLTADTKIRIKAPRRELTGDTRIRLSQIKDLADWVEDKYDIGDISRRKDGDYRKITNKKWIKISPTEKEYKNGETNFEIVPRSLGAMATRFYVEPAKTKEGKSKLKVKMTAGTGKGKKWYLKEGTYVRGVKSIAHGKKIKDITRLQEKAKKVYNKNTSVEDWDKVRGTAEITNGEESMILEIHWYYCKNIGKIEYKEKTWEENVEWEEK